MATSPNYGWAEPDNTDLAKNGALAMRTLGNAIDTTVKSIDTRVTTVEGATYAHGWITGAYYTGKYTTSGTGNATNNTVYYIPFYVPSSMSIDRIGCESNTYSVTGNVNLGIYTNDATNFKPVTRVLSTNVSVTGAGARFDATVSYTMAAGWYWLAFQKTTGTFSNHAGNTTQTNPDNTLPVSTGVNPNGFTGWTETLGVAGLPATAGTLAQNFNLSYRATVRKA
jgi:hypothetical protein